MEKLKNIIKNNDWKNFYFFSLGSFVASPFDLYTTFACMVGGLIGFLFISAVDVLYIED